MRGTRISAYRDEHHSDLVDRFDFAKEISTRDKGDADLVRDGLIQAAKERLISEGRVTAQEADRFFYVAEDMSDT